MEAFTAALGIICACIAAILVVIKVIKYCKDDDGKVLCRGDHLFSAAFHLVTIFVLSAYLCIAIPMANDVERDRQDVRDADMVKRVIEQMKKDK